MILMLLALAGPAFAQIDTEAMKDRETTCFGKKATIVVAGRRPSSAPRATT